MNTDTSHREPPDHVEGTIDQMVDILPVGRISQEGIASVHSELAINNILPGLDLNEPTALLLDNNNLFLRARDNGFTIDFRRLKRVLENRCKLRSAVAFTAVDRDDDEATGWVQWMQKHGYDVEFRDLVRYTGRDGRPVAKGNMDVNLTIHAMKLSEAFTHVILGTCDGDFVPLVQELKRSRFRKVSVLGISGRNYSGMSRALIEEADNFYDLYKLQEHIQYRGERYD